jgi:hypothetical protein
MIVQEVREISSSRSMTTWTSRLALVTSDKIERSCEFIVVLLFRLA